MIMQQLRGEPLIWLSQDEYAEVLKDDAQVITALEERYGHAKARVSYTNQFEEAMQRSGEQRRSYMCRLQQLASMVFPELKDEDKRESGFYQNSCGACTIPVPERNCSYTGSSRKMTRPGRMRGLYKKAVRLESCLTAAEATECVEVRPVQSIAKTVEELNTEVSALREQVADLRNRMEYPQRSTRRQVGGRRFRHLQSWFCGSHNHGGGWCECPTRRREAPQWKPKVPQKANHSLKKDFRLRPVNRRCRIMTLVGILSRKRSNEPEAVVVHSSGWNGGGGGKHAVGHRSGYQSNSPWLIISTTGSRNSTKPTT